MRNPQDFILPVEGAIPSTVCRTMIKKFNESTNIVKRETDKYKFQELNISQDRRFESETKYLEQANSRLFDLYTKTLGVKYFPEQYTFEEFRMKKYMPNSADVFDWHVDVGDHTSSKRFLVFLYYLNTVTVGGETAFDWDESNIESVKVQAIEGGVVMFPPVWLFPHKGMRPISGPKYIISSYAHYL